MTLPNFFILGAAKCATTSLANHLRAHPDVFIPDIKEVAYFNIDARWAEGRDWYEDWFAEAAGERAVGDATPAYLYVPEVLDRLTATVGTGARLIVQLRDPVHRTYSHYQHRRREGVEHRSLDEVLDEELGGDEGWGYVGRGRYLEQIRRWVDVFGEDALHVVLFEDFVTRPHESYAAVCRHLGIDPTFRPDDLGERYNTHFEIVRPRLYQAMVAVRLGKVVPPAVGRWLWDRVAVFREYSPIDAATRERLRAYFAPHNRALEQFLGRDLRAVWGY
ncbi:MAG TPA: sulfotransferase [Acidimicrobiales bacterium]|nr:sulfotransferase [Acidimicrobiales bacterium]